MTLEWNDPAGSVRFPVGGVRDSRFAARFAPFPDKAATLAALKKGGAKLHEVPA
jgi:hypothetical protein